MQFDFDSKMQVLHSHPVLSTKDTVSYVSKLAET